MFWVAVAWAGSDEVLGDLDRFRVNAAYPEAELQVAARTRAAVEKLKISPAGRDAEAAWRVARNGGDPRSVARWLSAVSNRDPSPSVRRDAAARAARVAPIAEKLAAEAPRFEEAMRLVGLHRYAAARERLDPLRALVPEDPEIDWWIGESWLGEALGADATVDPDTPSPALLGWSVAIPSPDVGLAPERALSLADDAFGRAQHVAPAWIRARISGFEVKVAVARRDPGALGDLVPPARGIEANAARWPLDDRRDAARVLGLYRYFGGAKDGVKAALDAFDEGAALGDPISAWNAALLRAKADPSGWALARATSPLAPGPTTWWVGPTGDLGAVAASLGGGLQAYTLPSGPSVLVVDGEAYVWTPDAAPKDATIVRNEAPAPVVGDARATGATTTLPLEPEIADAEDDETRPRPAEDVDLAGGEVLSVQTRQNVRVRPPKKSKPAAPSASNVAEIPHLRELLPLRTPYHAEPLLTPAPTTVSVTRRAVCDRGHCTPVLVVSNG